MSQITDVSGRPVSSLSAGVDPSSITRVEDSLSPKDVGKLDFQLFGARMMVEAVAPDTVSQGGIVLPQGGEDKPYYRVLRFGSPEYVSQINKVAKLGDVVFTRQFKMMSIFHRFPRHERNKIQHDRIILMLDYQHIDAVIPGYAWEDSTPAERKVGDMPIADFSEDFVNTVTTDMLTPEEAEQIDFMPLGDKVIVEQVPAESVAGKILIPEAGQHQMPIYRLLKCPADRSVLPPHLADIQVGDLMLIMNVDRMRDDFPTKFKKPNGGKRDIRLTSAGFALGWWPSLSFRNLKGEKTSFSETSKAEESGV